MSVTRAPIFSEFETSEQEARYDHWFRTKVEEAMDSRHPRLSHDAAMARAQALLEERRRARASGSVD